ncbi:histidine phosphatase family protein [Fibrella sp. HMF5335]|uniref:Histidine phosphatase family protein n=1 Tax=Fibrella rubiginis TaxID=2817060 RepID=A0A939GG89_9BACT|nr:histidine phosphatase family protein [Fibrella rubiginis]MBO0936240.1 histidine phosphatase family protein [Fibrella rubiginis]
MLPNRLLLQTGLLSGIACCLLNCSTATYYVVRHAERANETDTTSLSAVGLQRADKLATRLGLVKLDSIYATPYTRTRQTALPTARAKNLPVTQYPTRPPTELSNRLLTFKGQSALVVGHSNTVLPLVAALGAKPTIAVINHGDYQYLFIVTRRQTPFGKRVYLREETY